MPTQPIKLRKDMTVTELYSVHYIEMDKNYVFTGETHEYWEVLYVDRNNVLVTRDEETFRAVQGDIIMIAPGQFHAFRCDEAHGANMMMLAFGCKSPKMQFLRGAYCPRFSDTIMGYILQHCKNSFERVLTDPHEHTLVRKPDVWAGRDTFISIALTEMLLTIWRNKDTPQKKDQGRHRR